MERTLNIWLMSVTLGVSRLSGWLNEDASWTESGVVVVVVVRGVGVGKGGGVRGEAVDIGQGA